MELTSYSSKPTNTKLRDYFQLCNDKRMFYMAYVQ